MSAKLNRFFARGAVAVAFTVLFAAAPASAADGPFSGLEGSWSGGGTINMRDGRSERLRCRVTYSVGSGGTSARQDLRCASDSYRVDINSSVQSNGQSVSGNWTETSRGVSGQLQGRMNGQDLLATVNGPGFGAGISIATRANSQTVSIRVNNGDVAGVQLALKKQ